MYADIRGVQQELQLFSRLAINRHYALWVTSSPSVIPIFSYYDHGEW